MQRCVDAFCAAQFFREVSSNGEHCPCFSCCLPSLSLPLPSPPSLIPHYYSYYYYYPFQTRSSLRPSLLPFPIGARAAAGKISTGGVILNGTVLDVADLLTINEGGEGDRAGAYSNGRTETCRRGRPGTKRKILYIRLHPG